MLAGTETGRFLSGQDLSRAIAELISDSQELRCAVAFWGHGAKHHLFGDRPTPKQAKIVCDLTMGGTNPKELRKLGAPHNENLKHLPGLHAKIYLAETGLITTSANASNNGIGFIGNSALIEAGTFHSPANETFRSAEEWFERVWKDADVVDERALDAAQNAWDRRRHGGTAIIRQSFAPDSLFGTVLANPSRFRGVGFVFSVRTASEDERDDAASGLLDKKKDLDQAETIRNWPTGNI